MNIPVLRKDTVAGKVALGSYTEFKTMVKKEAKIADFFARIDVDFGQKIEACADIKRAVDFEIKKFKAGEKQLREYMTKYMREEGLKKVEGDSIKSINYHKAEEEKKEIAVKQIKAGRAYVDVETLTKDDLVDMLEAKGVKVRTTVRTITKEKKAGIRVVR